MTRLREQIPIPLEVADEGAPAHLIAEAADEIERWRKIAEQLYLWLQPSPEDDSVYEAGIEAMAMYDEAVRGE